jgi:hypothetical protein
MITPPKGMVEKQSILSDMASKFSMGKEYPEPRVDEVINRFNVDNPLQFKSELISNGYLKISVSGNRYFLLKKSPTPEEMEKFVTMDKEREEVEMLRCLKRCMFLSGQDS